MYPLSDFFKRIFRSKTDYTAKTPEQRIAEAATRKARAKLEDIFVKALRASSETLSARAELSITEEAIAPQNAEKSR